MKKVKLIALTGFLGAGKTTTMTEISRYLETKGETVAMVTNDQGLGLVDSALAALVTEHAAEVTGGCYCCRFDDLSLVLDDLLARGEVTAIVIEAVGSCTDLQATVIRPLQKFYGDRIEVAPLMTVVDPARYDELLADESAIEDSDLSYLFDLQLREANVIGVNKEDKLDNVQKKGFVAKLKDRYPKAEVILYSALCKRGIDSVLKALSGDVKHWNLDVDYDRYAAAEADLAWLNINAELIARGDSGFLSGKWVMSVLGAVGDYCKDKGATIGHAKIHLATDTGVANGNLIGDGNPRLVSLVESPSHTGKALVNVRATLDPEELDNLIVKAINEASEEANVDVKTGDSRSFRPSYPKPTHRIEVES